MTKFRKLGLLILTIGVLNMASIAKALDVEHSQENNDTEKQQMIKLLQGASLKPRSVDDNKVQEIRRQQEAEQAKRTEEVKRNTANKNIEKRAEKFGLNPENYTKYQNSEN